MNKIFYFDVETTGLHAIKNDIIQLAYIIEIDKKVAEEGSINLQPFDYNNIEQAALDTHKIAIAMMKKLPLPSIAYKKICEILSKYVDKYNKNDKFSPAGYNVRFDVRFLRSFFLKNNDKFYGSYFDYHLLDPLQLLYILEYRGLIKLENYKLETVAKYFNIKYKAHDAFEDIKTTREVFLKLLDHIKEK